MESTLSLTKVKYITCEYCRKPIITNKLMKIKGKYYHLTCGYNLIYKR